jgi:hypothetical protein
MTPDSIRSEIDRLITGFLKAELIVDSTPHIIHFSPNNLRTITWSVFNPSLDTLFATVDEYKRLVLNRQYSLILLDGSLLQFSYTFQRDNLIKHRLCFYPFPLSLEPEEWEVYQEMGIGLVDILEDLGFEEYQRRLQLRSPIRFDYDLHNANSNHPASHLHIVRSDCRVPVFAPLSIGHFVRFVFRNFYFEQWETFDFVRTWPVEWHNRTLTSDEMKQIHLNCIQG